MSIYAYEMKSKKLFFAASFQSCMENSFFLFHGKSDVEKIKNAFMEERRCEF